MAARTGDERGRGARWHARTILRSPIGRRAASSAGHTLASRSAAAPRAPKTMPTAIETHSMFTRALASLVRGVPATRCAAAPPIVRGECSGAIGRSSTDQARDWHATCEGWVSAGGLLPAIAMGGISRGQ